MVPISRLPQLLLLALAIVFASYSFSPAALNAVDNGFKADLQATETITSLIEQDKRGSIKIARAPLYDTKMSEDLIVSDPTPKKVPTPAPLPKAVGKEAKKDAVSSAPPMPPVPAAPTKNGAAKTPPATALSTTSVPAKAGEAEQVRAITYERRILYLEEVRQILATTKDFAHKNLGGLVMQEFDFSNADLTEANLENSDLYHCNFSRANLTGANLKGASLEMANFSKANLKSAQLSQASLFLTNMQDSNLESAQIRDCYAAGVKLQRAILRNTDLKGSYFVGDAGSGPADSVDARGVVEDSKAPEGKPTTFQPHRK